MGKGWEMQRREEGTQHNCLQLLRVDCQPFLPETRPSSGISSAGVPIKHAVISSTRRWRGE
jgi:hypothetical protein